MSDKPRMLWVARDTRGEKRLSVHIARPELLDIGLWSSAGRQSSIDAPGMFDDLQHGECRMFVEFAPRVANKDDPSALMCNGGTWGGWLAAGRVDIISPFGAIPDPTPYLTQADTNAARREEIRAQIAALQAELDRMEG